MSDNLPAALNSGLTAVLRASLAIEQSGENPLTEADPASLDELFARLNDKLVAGMPEAITDADLLPVVNALRAQRLKWLQEQDRKTAAGPSRRAPAGRGKVTSVAQAIARAEDMDI